MPDKKLVSVIIIALLGVILIITAIPIGQAQNGYISPSGIATTGSCLNADNFVTQVGNTTIACAVPTYGACPNGQFDTAIVTTTLNCASPPAQTNEYYGSCPSGQAATAITTTTLNCATFLTTQTSQFFSYGSCSAGNFPTAITTTTLSCNPISIQGVTRNSFTCSDVTSGTNLAMGFALNYTIVGNGIVSFTLNFDLSTPNVGSATHTLYQIWYGTGNPPTCNGINIGNPCGIQYEFVNAISFSGDMQITMICVKTGLSLGTTYWFDIAVTDSSTAAWVYGYPSATFIES